MLALADIIAALFTSFFFLEPRSIAKSLYKTHVHTPLPIIFASVHADLLMLKSCKHNFDTNVQLLGYYNLQRD